MSVSFSAQGRVITPRIGQGQAAPGQLAPEAAQGNQAQQKGVETSRQAEQIPQEGGTPESEVTQYEEATFSAAQVRFGAQEKGDRSNIHSRLPLFAEGRYAAVLPQAGPRTQPSDSPQAVKNEQPTPQPGPERPVPGSSEYQRLIAQGKAITISDVAAFIDKFKLPGISHAADSLHEASLDLGQHGYAGVVIGTVSATAIEYFVPTHMVDLIPGAKIIRKGKKVTAIRQSLEEFQAMPKVVKGKPSQNDVMSRIPSLNNRSSMHLPDKPNVLHVESGRKNHAWSATLNGKLQPDTSYIVDGFQYNTNKAGLVESVAGDIRSAGQRNTYQQAKVGRSGLPDDEGGHLLPAILGGPGEAINLIPQNANFNRGAWNAFGDMLQKAYESGADVKVRFSLSYGNASMPHRPTQIVAEYEINGVHRRQTFQNRPGGK